MNYPLISEYIEAIKSAEDNFEELSYLRPVLGDDGLPVMTSGNFAVVFKMKDERDGKLYAVKCFTKEQEGRSESYKLIAEEFEFASSNYLTPIRFLEKELFVDTEQTSETEFPVLLMDWVEGKTLDKYIKENSDEKYILEMLTFQFCKMASWMIFQPFAHGDLKPDNILIKEDGHIVLVDYDGMYVPAMKGQKAKEIGSPGFRHPKRTKDGFDENIDDFSIALIAMSLKAFALNNDLIDKYCSSEFFFFKERDFESLHSSQVMPILLELLSNEEFCSLYGAFMIALANNSLALMSPKILSISTPQKGLSYGEYIYAQARGYCEKANDRSKIDYNKAFKLFMKAAQLGNADAQCCVGCCFKSGYGTQVDYSEARVWYDKSSKNGCPRAFRHIAMLYEKGMGIDQDIHEAIRWYQEACDKGDYGSMKALGNIYYYGREGISIDYSIAFNCYQKASEAGESDAMWRLGYCYLDGKGIEIDYPNAVKWFKKASDQNNSNGLLFMGYCYENGFGVEKNLNAAFDFYQKAMEAGSSEGLYRLGLFFEKGIVVKQNLEKAQILYESAAKVGHKDAIEKLNTIPKSKDSVKQIIKTQFLRVEMHHFYSYIAIVNTLICQYADSLYIRPIWIPPQMNDSLSVNIQLINLYEVKCSYSYNGIRESSFVSACDVYNIDDVVELSYELLDRLGLIESFISNGAEAIDEINDRTILKYH